jgi:hypothetical protein
MAKAISADAVVRLWAERGAASGETVKAGVNAVTENPAAKAANAVDTWAANVAKAKQKFVDSLQKVTLQSWKASMTGKGVQNMAAGYADAATQAKFLAFMRAWLPYVRDGAAQVRAMPKGNLEQGIARAVAMIRHNAAFRRPAGGVPIMQLPRPLG